MGEEDYYSSFQKMKTAVLDYARDNRDANAMDVGNVGGEVENGGGKDSRQHQWQRAQQQDNYIDELQWQSAGQQEASIDYMGKGGTHVVEHRQGHGHEGAAGSHERGCEEQRREGGQERQGVPGGLLQLRGIWTQLPILPDGEVVPRLWTGWASAGAVSPGQGWKEGGARLDRRRKRSLEREGLEHF